MSAEVQESGGKNGKSKQKKFAVRVDFTPMVDMNMLLITFFMLCTTLSKPQTMEISMPSNDKNITEEQKSMVKASQAITLSYHLTLHFPVSRHSDISSVS